MKATASQKENLREGVKELRQVVDHAGALSMILTGTPTDKYGKLSSIIHARMWANAHSLLAIVGSGIIDHSAILTISRMILEGFVIHSYVNAEVSNEEREFRYLLLKFHDTNSRINLMSMTGDRSSYVDLLDGREMEKSALTSHPFFQTLDKEQQDRCVSGSQAYVRGLRRAALEAGFEDRKFNSVYGYLSGHSHTLPISLFRVPEHKIDYFDPSEAQLGMAALAVTIAIPCLLAATFNRIDQESDLHVSWRHDNKLRALLQESAEGLIKLPEALHKENVF